MAEGEGKGKLWKKNCNNKKKKTVQFRIQIEFHFCHIVWPVCVQ